MFSPGDGGAEAVEMQMSRLFIAVIGASCCALIWLAAQSPFFNADVSSPALVRTLATDYVAVDAIYGGVTSPYSIDAAVHSYAPPPAGVGNVDTYRPGFTVARADDGVRYAKEAEAAVSSLGATAELRPIRRELLQSYQDVEQAWKLERSVEQAFNNEPPASLNIMAEAPDVQSAAQRSVLTIQQARSLHDQAMAAITALTGDRSSAAAAAGVSVYAGRPYGLPYQH